MNKTHEQFKPTRHTSKVELGTINLADGEQFFPFGIDFKEMNSGTIQIVVGGADVNDGSFELYQSLEHDFDTFAKYPDGILDMDPTCPNLAANFNHIPFRFMRIKYIPGTDTTGTARLIARAKK